MHRLSLLALSLALWASVAQAQTGPGVIHYKSGTTLYAISGAPNSVPTLEAANLPADGVYATTDLKYGPPGSERHFYFTDIDLGSFPDGTKYGDHYAWDEATRATVQVTRFRSSRYLTSTTVNSPRWSNDRQDSFFSFAVNDVTAGQVYLVRARVTGAQIAASTPEAPFEPLTEADLDPTNPAARLEVVASLPRYMSHYWHQQGTGLYVVDDRISGGYKLRFHPVGTTPIDADPVVFDESVTKIRISVADVSPATGQLVLQVQTKVKSGYADPSGLIVLNPNNPAPNNWNWLVTETTSRTGLESIGSPFISPDGLVVAFTATRTSNGKVVAIGLYRIDLTGGAVSTIREEAANSSGFSRIRWTW